MEADAETVERVIREVLARGGEKFRALTANELEPTLEEVGVGAPDRSSAVSWLRWAEAARFGGASVQPPTTLDELGALLTRLDRQLETA